MTEAQTLPPRPSVLLWVTYVCVAAAVLCVVLFMSLDWASGDEPVAYSLIGLVLPLLCAIGLWSGLRAAKKGALSVPLSMVLVAFLIGLIVGVSYLWFFIPIIRMAIRFLS